MTYECGAWHACSCPIAVLDRDREIESQRAVINQQATIIAIATEHHDRVIARLLDGWRAVDDEHGKGWYWYPEHHGLTEPISDGEAVIIRAHTETKK